MGHPAANQMAAGLPPDLILQISRLAAKSQPVDRLPGRQGKACRPSPALISKPPLRAARPGHLRTLYRKKWQTKDKLLHQIYSNGPRPGWMPEIYELLDPFGSWIGIGSNRLEFFVEYRHMPMS